MAQKRKKSSVAAKRRQYEAQLKVHTAVIEQKKQTIERFKDPAWIAEQISDAEDKIADQESKIPGIQKRLDELPVRGETHEAHKNAA